VSYSKWLLEEVWATQPNSLIGYNKSAPSPPPPPDYEGAARQTAAGNLQNIRAQTQANRVNTYTPYGSQTFTQPDKQNNPDWWRSNITLAPEAQKTLDSQLRMSKELGNLGTSAIGRTKEAYSDPMDLSSVPEIADQSYAMQTSRLDPQWAAREESQQARLANQGITHGSDAYNESMRTFDQGRNDAYQQARLASISTMPQTYQLASATRNQPLNELNAIRTGAQIQNPSFQAYGQAGAAPGANMLGAAQAGYGAAMDGYNAQAGQANAFNSGLFGLGAAAVGAPWFKLPF
jgi:hypothetical protein